MQGAEFWIWFTRMNQDGKHDICAACRRLYDKKTGKIVPGWERARHISAGKGKCLNCATVPQPMDNS